MTIMAALLAAIFLAEGCHKETASPPPLSQATLTEDKDGNFILYVSNQSSAVNPVDIRIFIDGKVAVNELFDVTGKRTPQHNWKKFQFSLSKGTHELRISSKQGKATLEKDFEINNEHWAVVDYWYYPRITGGAGPTPRSFTFDIKDKPIGFQ